MSLRTTTAASAALLLLASTGCDRGQRPQQLGRPAPAFSVSDGKTTVDSARMRGHVVLLNFWASWCAPCLEELPSLEDLHHQLPGVEVVGISIDEDSEAYARFVTLHRVDFLTVDDPAQKSNALFNTFRPPESYVIDKQGVIRRKFIGPQTWTSPEIVRFLKQLEQQ